MFTLDSNYLLEVYIRAVDLEKNGLSITTVTKFISSTKKCGLTWEFCSGFKN